MFRLELLNFTIKRRLNWWQYFNKMKKKRNVRECKNSSKKKRRKTWNKMNLLTENKSEQCIYVEERRYRK